MANERESYDAGREALRQARGGSAARRRALARYLESEAYRERRDEQKTEPEHEPHREAPHQDAAHRDEEPPDGERT